MTTPSSKSIYPSSCATGVNLIYAQDTISLNIMYVGRVRHTLDGRAFVNVSTSVPQNPSFFSSYDPITIDFNAFVITCKGLSCFCGTIGSCNANIFAATNKLVAVAGEGVVITPRLDNGIEPPVEIVQAVRLFIDSCSV
jgi:hypothetical protein